MEPELPSHVAVIQDGNRRYARSKGELATEGHRYGADTTEDFLDWCIDLEIPEVTLYSFSTENFDRTDEELEQLFDIVRERLYELGDDDKVHDNEARVQGVGEREMLPERVVEALAYAEDQTRGYSDLQLNIALAYGGREELLSVAREIVEEAREGLLDPGDITEETVSSRLYVDDVDLVIRTGGERRTSNFLPWQTWGNEAHVEFLDCLWPEFTRSRFEAALQRYSTEVEDSKVLEAAADGAAD